MAETAIIEAVTQAINRNQALAPLEQPPPGQGPKQLSIRHMEIMDFLMSNPRVKLGDVAARFGVTQGWLSQIIHSDAFQAMLAEKQSIAFHETVLPIREKMKNVAHLALDKLAEQLPKEQEVSTLSSVASSILDRLGYGTKPAPGTVINNTQVNVLRGELDEARKIMHSKVSRSEVIIDGQCAPIGLGRTPTEVQGESVSLVGEALLESPIQSPGAANSAAEAGGAV